MSVCMCDIYRIPPGYQWIKPHKRKRKGGSRKSRLVQGYIRKISR